MPNRTIFVDVFLKRAAAFLLGLVMPFATAADSEAQDVRPANGGNDQRVPPVQPAVAAPPPPFVDANDDRVGNALLLYSDRVQSTVLFARTLRSSCPAAPVSEEMKALLEKALIKVIQKARGLDALEARRRKLEQDAALAPRDGRIIAALALVARDKKKLEDAARLEAQGKGASIAVDLSTLLGSFCRELCSEGQTAESPVNVCAFSSPTLANAAAIADFGSVEALSRYVAHRVDEMPILLSDKTVLKLKDLVDAEPGLEKGLALLGVKSAASKIASEEKHTGLDVMSFTASAVDLGIRALANVIVDRARRESLVYFVERLHADVCGPEDLEKEPDAATFREIRSFWLPTTCGLAAKPLDFLQYGGGATLLSAFRGAIASDVQHWPASAMGLSVGASFWLDAGVKDSLFACSKGLSTSPVCDITQKLRIESGAFFSEVSRGQNAALSLSHFASALDALNTPLAALGKARAMLSPNLQIAACAASIPLVFQEYAELVGQTRPGRDAQTEALLLAALVSSPACFSLVGEGFSDIDCPGFSQSGSISAGSVCQVQNAKGGKTASLQRALTAPTRLEKLTTLARWANAVNAPALLLGTRWQAVVDAFDAYETAAKEQLKAPSGGLMLLSAAELLGEASLDLALVFAKAGGKTAVPALYPGLCAAGPCQTADISARFAAAEADLSRLRAALDLLVALRSEDEGQLVARVITTLRAETTRLCTTEECKKSCLVDGPSCGPLARLSRHGGLFAALVFDTDPNRIAAALDAAAMPVGGWRRKNVPGSFTVSIGSFPGLTVGTELRFGPYANRKETFQEPYFLAPTLTIPVGFDFAQGYGNYNLGVFVSALDPGAYLQYDVEQNGRLPGAQLLTVLSPGVWLRAGVFGSPLALSAYAVFRPGLRAWESALSTPGAHALQFGIAASVDVSLFDLFTGPPSP